MPVKPDIVLAGRGQAYPRRPLHILWRALAAIRQEPEKEPRRVIARRAGFGSAVRCTSARRGGELSAAGPSTETVQPLPDIGVSRASMAITLAEILGVPVERVRLIVADTSSTGFPPDRRQPHDLRDRHGDNASRPKGRRGTKKSARQ
jgi:hypothetical protein